MAKVEIFNGDSGSKIGATVENRGSRASSSSIDDCNDGHLIGFSPQGTPARLSPPGWLGAGRPGARRNSRSISPGNHP